MVILTLKQTLLATESNYLTSLLDACHGNVSAVARLAGISRQQLYARLRVHRIELDRDRPIARKARGEKFSQG